MHFVKIIGRDWACRAIEQINQRNSRSQWRKYETKSHPFSSQQIVEIHQQMDIIVQYESNRCNNLSTSMSARHLPIADRNPKQEIAVWASSQQIRDGLHKYVKNLSNQTSTSHPTIWSKFTSITWTPSASHAHSPSNESDTRIECMKKKEKKMSLTKHTTFTIADRVIYQHLYPQK